jgi:hypothetical protein
MKRWREEAIADILVFYTKILHPSPLTRHESISWLTDKVLPSRLNADSTKVSFH